MNKKFLITAGVLIAVVIVFWVIPKIFFKAPAVPANQNTPTAQQNTTTEAPSVALFDSDSITTLTDQTDKEYAFAFDKARAWRTDSILMSVIVKYNGPIEIKNGKDSYVFYSPSLPGYFFDITLDQEKTDAGETHYERVIRFKEDFVLPSDIGAIPLTYWKLNFIEALKKADDLGGKEIRKTDQNYSINMALYTAGSSYLAWNIEYLSGGSVLFRVPINAFNGEAM